MLMQKERVAEAAVALADNTAAILDAIPDLIFEVDQEGRFYSYHAPRPELLVAPPETFLGKTVAEVMPPDVAETIFAALQEAGETGYSSGKCIELALDSGQRWFDLFVTRKAACNGNEVRFFVVSRDVTAHHQAVNQANRLTRLYSCLSRCNRAFLHSRNQDELFENVCGIVTEAGGLEMAWIGLIDTQNARIKPVAARGFGTEQLDGIAISFLPGAPGSGNPASLAVQEEQPCWLQSFDPRINAPDNAWIARAGWLSSAAIPLFIDARCIGAWSLHSPIPDFFADDICQLLLEIAMDVSHALGVFAHEEKRLLAEQRAQITLEKLKHQKFALDQHAIVAVTDAHGKITYANDKFCEISGYARKELIRQDHIILNSGVHPKGFFKAMYEVVTRGDVWHAEVCNHTKDGRLIWLDTTIVPFMNGKGQPEQYIAIRTDITERKANELELQRHREHLEDQVQQQTEGLQRSMALAQRALNELEQQKFVLDQHAIVAITDIQGTIIYVNDKFCEISGHARENLLGQNHNRLNSGVHPKNFFTDMYRTITQGKVWRGEICNRRPDDSLFWLDTTIVPFMGEDGKPKQYIAMRTDITERKRIEEAAHAANRAKSEFLANMSHEIRTPMNGVIGMVDILRQSDLNSKQLRMVRTIQDSSLALLGILNDILDFSKIEAGKLAIESISTSLREVVESSVQLMFSNADARSIALYSFVSPQLPGWIASDPTRLRQILLNLLGNAVKFTAGQAGAPGRVVLRAEPGTLPDGRSGVTLRVIDNGIGMSQETLKNLFQPFTQADVSTSRKFGGTGLGLSITQRLTELLGGRISVRSALGEGTEVCVELPLQEAAPAKTPAQEPDLTGIRVLAVCRNDLDQEILSAYCQTAGAEIEMVTELTEDHLSWQAPSQATTPLVLLLDLEAAQDPPNLLPDHVRFMQLVKRGRSIPATSAVTVLTQPLLYHDLVHGVAVAAGRLRAIDDTALADRRQRSRSNAPTVLEALSAHRLILLAEDNQINREVILEQLRLLGYTAEVAEDGQIALDMWRTGRYALLLTDCHMPNMDGFELTASIRKEEPSGTLLPIIAVTANALQGESERCLEHGMSDYLSKPIRLEQLEAMMGKWLPLPQESAKKIAAASPATPAPPASIEAPRVAADPIWDAATLTRMVGDNPGMHKRLLGKFVPNARDQVSRITAAMAQGDCIAAGRIAHALKSSARTVGALQLGTLCQDMETQGKANNKAACNDLASRLEAAFSQAEEQITRQLC
jgi:PAS domain S-box-containing protein